MCLLVPVCGSCSLTAESLCQLAELPSLRSAAALCTSAKALKNAKPEATERGFS